MSFTDHEPWYHFSLRVNRENLTVKWECQSCGSSGPKNGADCDPIHNEGNDLFTALLLGYRDHLKRSHKLFAPCGFHVFVGDQKFYCALMENHTEPDFEEGGMDIGPVPHKFDFEITLEAERKMGSPSWS